MTRRSFIKHGALWLPAFAVVKSRANAFGPLDSSMLGAAYRRQQSEGEPPASCDTVFWSITGADTTEYSIGTDSSATFAAATKTTTDGSSSGTCCAVALRMYRVGNPTNPYRIAVWSHDSGNDKPLALLGESADITPSSVGTSVDWFKVDITSPFAIAINTTVWPMLKCKDTLNDASNYMKVVTYNDVITERSLASDNTMSFESLLSTSRTIQFRLYKA